MEDLERIIENRKHTFRTIIECDSKEEINSVLPKPYQSNFDSFLQKLESFIKKEIDSYKELYSEATEDEEREEIEKIIDNLNEKLSYIFDYRNSFEKSDDKDIDNLTERSIIFGTSPGGNNCFLGDLKRIDREYLNEIQKMLNTAFMDNSNIKKLQGPLSKLYEIRSPKNGIRIHFRYLTSTSIYIIMIRIKRDTCSLKDNTEPRNRLSLLESDYEKVKKGIKIPEIRIQLEDKAAKDMEEIMAYINANKIVNGGGHHRN